MTICYGTGSDSSSDPIYTELDWHDPVAIAPGSEPV
jgi:hypothetical protein